MNLHERVGAAIAQTKMEGHAQRNIECRQSSKDALDRLLSELRIDERIELVFARHPAYGVRKALSVLILSANNPKELVDATEHAKLFANVHECTTIGTHDRITNRMSTIVDSIRDYLHLATHVSSEGGSRISSNERKRADEFLAELDEFKLELCDYMDSKAEVVNNNTDMSANT